MARVALDLQQVVPAGLAGVFTTFTTEGVSIPNSGNMFFEISNGDTVTKTITIAHGGKADGLAVASRTATIATLGRKVFGPFSTNYNQPGTNYLTVDSDTTLSTTIAAFQL